MTEFCLIAEGDFDSVEEAKHALIDPFIEDYVAKTGKYKIHNAEDIRVASGIALNDLSIAKVDEGVFEISCKDSPQVLNRRRAEQLAEELRRQAIFDEISVEELAENA
jgi:hypothetical protein